MLNGAALGTLKKTRSVFSIIFDGYLSVLNLFVLIEVHPLAFFHITSYIFQYNFAIQLGFCSIFKETGLRNLF